MRSALRPAALLLLTVLAALLLPTAALAAGQPGDDEFQQAVIEGRNRSREAYRRVLEQEALDADEVVRTREREVASRRLAAETALRDLRERDRTTANERLPKGYPIPWTLFMLGAVAILAIFVLWPRSRS